ncbi:hypothetical protein G6F59_007162 [Rhizopus arrhizus]|nr:hypothetical protein G6F59_007162 [Rhizopus arrhizus]
MKSEACNRAAELASATSANAFSLDNLGGFAQFVGANSPAAGIIAASRPSTPSSTDNSDVIALPELDPELVVIFKKISKRDSVTKVKALEELEAYLQANKNFIGLILNTWVGTYGKLVLEVDRRVRLAANQVHALVTSNVKKKLAPVLKDIIGPWLLSMHDQSKDIVGIAKGSFEAMFAADKRAGVISFCQKEILDYLVDMLLYKTAETLSDARYVTKEDMLSKYARIVSSSFQIISYLISELPVEQRMNCENEYNIILDDTTLWKKFASHSSPLIRKSLYSFIKVLLLSWKDMVEKRLDVICPSFFAAVFIEKESFAHSEMWDALLLMTKNFPQSWIIISKKKPSLPKLYNFLRLGLNGSVNIAYPSVLALLANLPEEIKSVDKFYTDVFDNFWKGLYTEFIEKANFQIFLDAYIECIVYFAITLSKKDDDSSKRTAFSLVQDKLWNVLIVFFLGSRDKVINEKIDSNAYVIVAKHLNVLASIESTKDLSTSLWSQLDQLFIQTIVDCSSTVTRDMFDMSSFSQKTGNFLVCMSQEIKKSVAIDEITNDMVKRLLYESVVSSVVHKNKSFDLLTLANQLISSYEMAIKEIQNIAGAVKQLLILFSSEETPIAPLTSFYVAAVVRLSDREEAKQLWNEFIEKIYAIHEQSEVNSSEIVVLALEQVKKDNAVDFKFQHEHLDTMVKAFSESPRTGVPRPVLENASQLLIHHLVYICLAYQILSDATVAVVLSNLETCLMDFNRGEHHVQGLKAVVSTLNMMERLTQDDENAKKISERESFATIPSQIFDAIFTSQRPHHYDDVEENDEEMNLYRDIQVKSAAVWDSISGTILSDRMDLAYSIVKQMRLSILDVTFTSSPSDFVQRAKKLLSSSFFNQEAYQNALSILLGTKEEWEHLFVPFIHHTTDYLSLAILDPFVALSADSLTDDKDELMPVSYDMYGLSSFVRLALFWGEYLSDLSSLDLVFADGRNDWLIHQLMIASVACDQGLSAPNACRIWEKKAIEGIRIFIKHSQDLFSNWLSFVTRSSFNISEFSEQLLASIKARQPVQENKRLLSFTSNLVLSSQNVVLCANVLQSLLCKLLVLTDWPVSELQKWLPFIKAEATELDLLMKTSLLRAFKYALSNTDPYRHYQSDLCSKLSGATSLFDFDYYTEDDSANDDLKKKRYWSILGLLNASSLKVEPFDIPRQRIMYLIQSLRPLLSQDFEFSSDQQKARTQAQFAQLLKHLAESVPDELGGHWDYFLESCFTWTAYADANQPEELLVLYYALDLYQTLVTLSHDNEALYESVKEHLPSYGKLLLELAAKEYGKGVGFKVRTLYQKTLSNLLEYIPDRTLLEADCFSDLCQLIVTSNEELQKCAYKLLKKLIAQKVEDLSVRLEFTETSEEETHIEIDNNILSFILNPPDLSEWQVNELDGRHYEVFGYLLVWMLMLDHFNDITFKLKQEYTAELKEKEAFACLMPVLCAILNVGQRGVNKPFDLTNWNITEYDTEGFDGSQETSFYILASHLYYRSLRYIPSLVRIWWIDCKHRQLTLAVESYTEKYFSQPIINDELELVNRPDIKSQLEENEENEFTIKTLKAASEVTAKYVVDEQDMQIAIKLPSNYPLRQIEVEGVQKVGVNDKQWRGWMFSITAVIGSQVS